MSDTPDADPAEATVPTDQTPAGETPADETRTDEALTERLGLSDQAAEPAAPAESVTGGYLPPTTPPLLATGPGTADVTACSGPSVPTVLWGLLLAAAAAGAIVHQVSDVSPDLTTALPVALLAIGAALVLWGVSGLARRGR